MGGIIYYFTEDDIVSAIQFGESIGYNRKHYEEWYTTKEFKGFEKECEQDIEKFISSLKKDKDKTISIFDLD